MREDFCAFILTHGRPGKVITYESLRRHGYTGKVFIVIDDEDETGEEYRRIYGDKVLMFSKDEVARYTDQYDVSPIRLSTVWVRNALWEIAERVGCRYFVQLDDDYTQFRYSTRRGRGHGASVTDEPEYHKWQLRSLDAVFEALIEVLETTPALSIAVSQGGDHIGSPLSSHRFRRKAMNSFVCDTGKPFLFRGRLNEDVNTYLALGHLGHLFFTVMAVQLEQGRTQSNEGGMTEAYADAGTYVKSFYTVMAAPSCTTVRPMGQAIRPRYRGTKAQMRLHHHIDWGRAVPLIISQEFKKAAVRG
jgi:hypothetical protein